MRTAMMQTGEGRTAPVNKIIPFSAVDGFGNRTAIFLQGCNQDCLYCHNPETIHLCIGCGACVDTCPAGALRQEEKGGRVFYDYDSCVNCDTCIRVCTHGASPKIRKLTPEELFRQVQPFLPFIDGVTTSGGECGLYLDFLTEFYRLVKAAGKTTYMDTNGQIPLAGREEFLAVTDKTMIDLKAGSDEDHERLTGRGLGPVTDNICLTAELGKLYEIRTVVVPDLVDNRRTVELGADLIAAFPEVRYKLIKFRKYGVRESFASTPEPKDALMEELRELALRKGVKEVVIT